MGITLTKNKKTILKEKCGDCYYNGNCNISIKSCPYLKIRNKWKKTIHESIVLLFFMVAWAGIEPATHGFSVHCSTNWATEPEYNGGSNGTWTRDLQCDRLAC